jgi:molybdate transport system regulatory protein
VARAHSRPKAHGKGPGLASGPSSRGCRVSGRLWIEKDGETLLSWGRVVLLERIREHGSISAAARSMGMGYRHAWELVEEMNRASPQALVTRTMGGQGGGGTVLTAHGEAAIAHFWDLVDHFEEWLSRQHAGRWADGAKANTEVARKRG